MGKTANFPSNVHRSISLSLSLSLFLKRENPQWLPGLNVTFPVESLILDGMQM